MTLKAVALIAMLLVTASASAEIVRPSVRLALASKATSARSDLKRGWWVQSSAKVPDAGAAIATAGYASSGWTEATVPSTVLAARVAAGEYKDPYYAMNLRSIPGTTYPIAENFANLPMPGDSPYASSWWYRTEFRVPRSYAGRRVWLHLDGINYRANVWLNGNKVGDAKDIVGTYRSFALDVTDAIIVRGENALAVETFAPTEDELAVTWVDWNPMPPDKDMGIWRGVYLTPSGPVTIDHPSVATHFADDSLGRAELTVIADVRNASDATVNGVIAGTVAGIAVRKAVTLGAGEERTVRITPDDVPRLRVDRPRVWWPAPHGPQNLERVELRFEIGGTTSDTANARFGIREITAELTPQKHLLFRVNGKPILIRGGGWAPDMMLREPSTERLRTELEYVRDLNLNTIRLEGKMESDEFYDMCDEMGILVIAGWCCCSYWEMWDKWKPGDLEVARASLSSQIRRMRSHASMLAWLNGSDNPPPADVEKAYISELEAAAWPNPFVSNATQTPTTVTGESGVKMSGPYDYVVPSYWLRDTKFGGAFGFATEIGPGAAIPTIGSLRKMLPEKSLWPIDQTWNFHAGGSEFKDLERFNTAMREIYGEPTTLEEYEHRAQAMAYDGQRAMFEAYGRNKFGSTGVIQWMLNNAWPSMIWHLYDYYLQPAGGYFGTKKACEPLHIQYSYDDHGVVVVNDLLKPVENLKVAARVFDAALAQTYANELTIDARANSSSSVFAIPATAFANGGVHYVRLDLRNGAGATVSTNFYWLPETYATFDWEKTFFVTTPIAKYEDLRAIAELPKVHVASTASIEQGQSRDVVRIRLRNEGEHVAFQLHASVWAREGEVAPILWDDNYVSLLPGESRILTARVPSRRGPLEVRLDGTNIADASIHLGGGSASGER